jgi:hypothetical protein
MQKQDGKGNDKACALSAGNLVISFPTRFASWRLQSPRVVLTDPFFRLYTTMTVEVRNRQPHVFTIQYRSPSGHRFDLHQAMSLYETTLITPLVACWAEGAGICDRVMLVSAARQGSALTQASGHRGRRRRGRLDLWRATFMTEPRRRHQNFRNGSDAGKPSPNDRCTAL